MRGRRGATGIVLWAVILLGAFLWQWTLRTEQKVRCVPQYDRKNLAPYLNMETLPGKAYQVLYEQTGLGPAAVDALWRRHREDELLLCQENFFREIETECRGEFFLFQERAISDGMEAEALIPTPEDGDILITFNSHFLGWRNGHAAIVTDAERGLTVEAIALGRDSAVLSLDSWKRKPSFALLRLKGVSEEKRREIADYAGENLAGIPYRLSAGIPCCLSVGSGANNGTHCSHLVWYAYRQFGYDLDSDGGWIVTPQDLYESPLLEIVQVYGMEAGKRIS